MKEKLSIRTLIIWLLALAFFTIGLYQIGGYDVPLEQFLTSIGLPKWLKFIIGAIEIAGASALLMGRSVHPILPRLASLGLMMLVLGAISVHVIFDPLIKAMPATILFGLLLYSLWTTPPQTAR